MQSNPSSILPNEHHTVDDAEIAKFSAMAESWWDTKGDFKPLHDITPLRIDYIADQLCAHFGRERGQGRPLAGLRILDVGCGGGLAAEPLRRLGADVTGIDASERNIAIASAHAESMHLEITYHNTTAEALLEEHQSYDAVLALEIIEHVADVDAFLHCIAGLTNSGGMSIITTLNRTLKSLLLAKIGAEYIMRWLPIGTHDWDKFLRPSEIIVPMESLGYQCEDVTGMVYQPFSRSWRLDAKDISVNFLLSLSKN